MASAPSASRRRRTRRFRAAFFAGALCVSGGAPGLSVMRKDMEQDVVSRGAGDNRVLERGNEADYPWSGSDGSKAQANGLSSGSDCGKAHGKDLSSVSDGGEAHGQGLSSGSDGGNTMPQGRLGLATSDITESSACYGVSAQVDSHDSPSLDVVDGRTLHAGQALASLSAPAASSSQVLLVGESQKLVKRSREEVGQTIEAVVGRRGDFAASAPSEQRETAVAWLVEQMDGGDRGPKRYVFKLPTVHKVVRDVGAVQEVVAQEIGKPKQSPSQQSWLPVPSRSRSNEEADYPRGEMSMALLASGSCPATDTNSSSSGAIQVASARAASSPEQVHTQKSLLPVRSCSNEEADYPSSSSGASRVAVAPATCSPEKLHTHNRSLPVPCPRSDEAADADVDLPDDLSEASSHSDTIHEVDADTRDTIYEIVAELSGHSQQWVALGLVLEVAEALGRARELTVWSLMDWCTLGIMSVDEQRALVRFIVQPQYAVED